MKNNMLITSSGILKNLDKPRVGVIHQSELNQEYLADLLDFNNCIDLSYEEYNKELKEENLSEEEIEEILESYYCDSPTYLVGDAWILIGEKYEIDKTKEFAGIYHDGHICIEYSKHTSMVHYTSPCFVMSNGDGPCGDLSSPGEVLAYNLPKDYYNKED